MGIFEMNSEILRNTPPAMMKLFIYGITKCNFGEWGFENLFNPLRDNPYQAIFTPIQNSRQKNYGVIAYAGDLIIESRGTVVSLRDTMLTNYLAAEACLNDAMNRAITSRKLQILLERRQALSAQPAQPAKHQQNQNIRN